MKEVIKKKNENAPKGKVVKKNANDAIDTINTTNIDLSLELHRLNHFLRLNITSS